MRKYLFVVFACLVSASLLAHKPLKKKKHSINKKLKELVAFGGFKTASFGFLAKDVNTGEIIAEYNPDMALRPASNLKLITTASALELLSPDFRFITVLGYTGTIDTVHHILNGNIIIKGSGDPTLGSKYFDNTRYKQFLHHWKEAVKELGIDSIKGSIVADAGFFSRDIVPPSWSWQNMGNYFGAGPCGLSVDDNSYTVCFNTGNKVGDTVRILSVSPSIAGVEFDNAVIADSIDYDNSCIYGAPYCNKRYIRGSLPVGKERFCVKGSIPDPALVVAMQLDSVLRQAGTGVSGVPATIRLLKESDRNTSFTVEPFDTIFSPVLSEIVNKTNTYSLNLFAEHCALVAGLALGASPETVVAMDSIKDFWKERGMDVQGMRLLDGSGQSQYDAVTPKQLVYLLTFMKAKSIYHDVFINSLPVGGETGTLKYMFAHTPAKGNVRAKSGTIDGVKTYSGYVTTKSGREVVFSMMVNGFSCSSKQAKTKLEELMVVLAEFDK